MMFFVLWVCFVVYVFLVSPQEVTASLITFEVPSPAGILFNTRRAGNKTQRYITIERSAVALRPHWSRIHSIPVFSPNESSSFISWAEEYALSVGGWGLEHSIEDELPSVDVPVRSLLSESDFRSLTSYLTRSVLASMSTHFQLNAAQLHISDMFIAKYNASSEKRSHAPHKDKSEWSFIIALNSQRKRGTKLGSQFDGGGTRFIDMNQHWVQPVGEAIMFTGKALHEGVEVTRGVRYIMAGFCSYSEDWWEAYDPVFDGYAAEVGLRSGDVVRGLQVCSINENGIVSRDIRDVSGLSDDEWMHWVTSCEVLQPNSSLVIAVERTSD